MSLKRQIAEHYGAIELPPDRLEELSGMLRSQAGARRSSLRLAAAALAAGVLIAVGVFLGRGPDVTESVVREIALNHGKQLDSEYVADTYAALADRMDKLDFTLVAPTGLADRRLRVAGSRYCSLSGRIAAQVRLVDDRGATFTLYAVRDQDAFHSIEAGEVPIDGVRVALWREGGLLFGLAGPP